MGAGKSTLGPELAVRLGRQFVSVDALVEERTGTTLAEHFSASGEPAFRELEEQVAAEVLGRRPCHCRARRGRARFGAHARLARRERITVLVETTPEESWKRVAGSDRPLARDPEEFGALYEERRPLYEGVADGSARDADGALLAAAGIHVDEGAVEHLAELVPADGSIELVADATVASIHGDRVAAALGDGCPLSTRFPQARRPRRSNTRRGSGRRYGSAETER